MNKIKRKKRKRKKKGKFNYYEGGGDRTLTQQQKKNKKKGEYSTLDESLHPLSHSPPPASFLFFFIHLFQFIIH